MVVMDDDDDDCIFVGQRAKEDDKEMSVGFNDMLSSPVRKAPAPAPAPTASKAKATKTFPSPKMTSLPHVTAAKTTPTISKLPPASTKPETPLAKTKSSSSSSSSSTTSSSSSSSSNSPRTSTIKTESLKKLGLSGTAHKTSTSPTLTNGSGQNGAPKRVLDISKLEDSTKRRKVMVAEKIESVNTRYDNTTEPIDDTTSMNIEPPLSPIAPLSPKSPKLSVALVPYDDAMFTESPKYPWFTLIQVSHQLVKSCLSKYNTKEKLDVLIEKAMANLDDHEYYKQPDSIRAGVREVLVSRRFTTWVEGIGAAQKKMEGNIEQTVKYVYALLQILEQRQEKARKDVRKEQEKKQKAFGEQLQESLKVLSGGILEEGDESKSASIPELINKYHQTIEQLSQLHKYQKDSQRRSQDLKATFKFVFKHCELFEYLIEKMKAVPPVKPLRLLPAS